EVLGSRFLHRVKEHDVSRQVWKGFAFERGGKSLGMRLKIGEQSTDPPVIDVWVRFLYHRVTRWIALDVFLHLDLKIEPEVTKRADDYVGAHPLAAGHVSAW